LPVGVPRLESSAFALRTETIYQRRVGVAA